MGQHKRNPTAQLAKEGKLPPKPQPIGAVEQRRRVYRKLMRMSPFAQFAKSAYFRPDDMLY